jgi:hypothetical protein
MSVELFFFGFRRYIVYGHLEYVCTTRYLGLGPNVAVKSWYTSIIHLSLY